MEKKRRSGTRYLTVNNTPWEYRIGRNTVAITDPEGKRYFPRFRDVHKDDGIGHLNPATILNYVLTEIIGGEPVHQRCVCCKNIKSDVYRRVSPFNAEIYGDYTQHFFCNDCVAAIGDEI